MPDYGNPDRGVFLSGLDWLNDIGQVPLNVLRGNVRGASRKLVDVLADIPDAILPGDWIPEVSREEDDVTASEVAGVDRKAHPGLAKAVDIVGGAAINPLSWAGKGLPLRGVAEAGGRKVKDLAKRGFDRLPHDAQRFLRHNTDTIRRGLNWLDVPDEEEAMLRAAKGSGNIAATTARKTVEDIYQGLSQPELEAIGEIRHQINRKGTTDREQWEVLKDMEGYLAGRTADLGEEGVKRVRTALAGRDDLMKTILHESPELGIMGIDPAKKDAGYISRQFSGKYFDDEGGPLTLRDHKQADALRGRAPELETPEGVLRFLRNEEADLDFNALSSDLKRAQAQGKLVERAEIGKNLSDKMRRKLMDEAAASPLDQDVQVGMKVSPGDRYNVGTVESLSPDGKQATVYFRGAEGAEARKQFDVSNLYTPGSAKAKETLKSMSDQFLLSDPSHTEAVRGYIKDVAKQPGMRDYAYKLDQAFNGMPPRSQNWLVQLLHKSNKVFKGAATHGVILPRVAFNIRNRLSGLAQVLSNPEARKTAGGNASRILSDVFGAFDDGVMKLTNSTSRKFGVAKLTGHMDTIDKAFREAKGSVSEVRKLLKKNGGEDAQYLVEALDNGVLNNFVDSEQLLKRMTANPKWATAKNIYEWPAEVAQGLEQRMRLGTFLDLRKNGVSKTAADGAKTIRDTFLDYDVSGPENRAFRDFVPFGAFLSQNTKQQAKLLAEQPAIATLAAGVSADDEGLPKYPWLDKQLSVPWGTDEKGNPQYLSSTGLPLEGLTTIGADYRSLVNPLQPVLKTGIAALFDKDPLTGRAYGQYDKVFNTSAGTAGRWYNKAKGTGLIQPISGPLDLAGQLFDERKSAAERALGATTGMKFTSVDPDEAEQQRLEEYLKTRPDVRTAETLYQTEKDPEVQAMLKSLRQSKDRLREKRKAAASL